MESPFCTETVHDTYATVTRILSHILPSLRMDPRTEVPLPHLWAQMAQTKKETIELMHSVAAHTVALGDPDYKKMWDEAPYDKMGLHYEPDCGYPKLQAKVLKHLILHKDWGTLREVWCRGENSCR